MRTAHIRPLLAFAFLAMSAPLGAIAQTPDDESPSSIHPDTWRNLWTTSSPTLAELLSRRPFAPLGLELDIPPQVDGERSATTQLLKNQLRQQMQTRLQARGQQLSQALLDTSDSRASELLTPQSGVRDVVDLRRQRDSWRNVTAGEHATAAAQLYDALLAGRPLTLAEMQEIAGGQENYATEVAKLSRLAEAVQRGESIDLNGDSPAIRFLLAYHAAVNGDLPLARRSLNALTGQLPGISLDPIVQIRLRQLLN